MAQRSFPFDAGAGATISETDWQNMARRFRQTGVIEGSLSQLAVSADGSSLAVSVATGDAFVEGFFYRNDSALALTIAAANATNPRIDTVVVRLDRVANTAVLAVVTGTAAASPVAPTLSTADSLYELPLANVTVPAAAGVIVAGNVTDRRTLTRTFDSAAYVARADAVSGYVGASEGANSLGFTDLVTVGPVATATIGASGKALVIVGAQVTTATTGASTTAYMGFAVTGATTRAARGEECFAGSGVSPFQGSRAVLVTGLNPGSNTFTAKYVVDSGTGTWTRRSIIVIPL